MSSAIDATKPVAGSASTANVRSNFSAAKSEINELQRVTEDGVTAAGTADALVATFSNPVTLEEGVEITVKATGANTSTTPTLNVDGTGVKTIVKEANSALAAGDIGGAKHYLRLRYNNTDGVWVLLNPAGLTLPTTLAEYDTAQTWTANQTFDAHVYLNDNQRLYFGGSGEEGSLRSNGSATYWDLGADKDLYIRDATTSRFLFDSSSGNFHADGNIYAYSTSVGSDRNLKENIRAIEAASAKLDFLTGVQFDWIKDGSRDAGLIAQDVQLVLPEAVSEVPNISDETTRLNLNYNAVVGLLVQAAKEQKSKIESLELRLEKLGL